VIDAGVGVLGVTPAGRVWCVDPDSHWQAAFADGEAPGLLRVGTARRADGDDATVGFWRGLAEQFLRALCLVPEGDAVRPVLPPPPPAQLRAWVSDAPPMRGGEYLSVAMLDGLWARLETWAGDAAEAAGGLGAVLADVAPAWVRVGKVTVHLAENAGDPELPFAFIATYAAGVGTGGGLRQVPLGKALAASGDAAHRAVLLKLLQPLHRAAQACPFMAELVESGDVYHPLAWTAEEAYRFLQRIPDYEAAGLLVRVPNWWRQRTRRVSVAATIGERASGAIGLQALLDFRLDVVVDGQTLTAEEVDALLAGGAGGEAGLVRLRGEWVEIDRERLGEALAHWRSLGAGDGVSLIEGMRLLAGAPADLRPEREPEAARVWGHVQAGGWLEERLAELADPGATALPRGLRATLRPYQAQGVRWLWFCARTGLGACLADDMGLGKTMQVLGALLLKAEQLPGSAPALLVLPATLIANWTGEAARFAPGLRLFVAHRSETPAAGVEAPDPAVLASVDLVVTSYGMLTRHGWLRATRWSWVIFDEAQALKNPGTRQGKAARQLDAEVRIALTGTPIENRLGDLWSLFDIINPGLLGTATEFKRFLKGLGTGDSARYGPLRRLVGPYILRRLKTDRRIIADLPEKTEMAVRCGLSAVQARLYQQTARQLHDVITRSTGMERKGLVLSYLMRFKQICNHPDQFTGSGDYAVADSAKFARLVTLCEEIASRGEKALVFTQFRQLAEPLARCLAPVFGREGLVLHGGTPVAARSALVERFQRDDGPPFFVLSLKAGGTGLTLTAASHVIHVDRWWNPAVENQATDRAFRIGQRRNVLVHKFITSGTLEERIDALITGKQHTADAILSDGPEHTLTEMSNDELLEFVRLDLNRAGQSA
jgi:superfamily II DNA or RNA helicase